jgi:3-oxoacyl-[acyl-carrier protein] reductase
MNGLDGKVAMVTGGGTGIGAAVVERLATLGARVACCYNKSAASAQALASKLSASGARVYPVRIDVTDSQQVREGIRCVAEYFGQSASILVNNAGDNIDPRPIESMDEETWQTVIATNLTGAFLCAKYCIPGMKAAGGGQIINISSISAHTGGGPGSTHYVASKGGLEAFTRALAKELAPHNIRVNAVAPGVIYTPIHERTNTPESLERLRQTIPVARIGLPAEVAGVVAFLCSEDASYIVGEVIAVNGGMRMD